MNKEKLIELTIKNPMKYAYINLDNENKYKGWVYDFRLVHVPSNQKLGLDLRKENDLFLLFVLASAWSRTGPWENAVFFTAHLKMQYDISNLIQNKESINPNLHKFDINSYKGIDSRKSVFFRKDLYNSVDILIKNWSDIKQHLEVANQTGDWLSFIKYISSINGLGTNNKKMRIKILLILRELRCQKIYSNIDGKYCCVADARVKEAYKTLNLRLPVDYIKASQVIYNDFGDLYDIPPFALNDFIQDNLI